MIPIASPHIGEEEKRAVMEVLESGQLAQGARVEEFERAFASWMGVKHAVATSSGTTALWVALLSHGVGPGDWVVTTPFTFIASANAILYTGARASFVDIEPDTYNLDPSRVEAKIQELRGRGARVKAVLPVHLYGHPCDMDALSEIVRRHDLLIIEDACQAHGATFRGKLVGSFGTGCFSFYPTKNIMTAEGGIVVTNDPEIDLRARMLRNHGSRQRYHHEILGYNFRMTDLQAAIGIVQLEKLSAWTKRRIENAAVLTQRLSTLPRVTTPTVRAGCVHAFHQYTVRIDGDRDAAVRQLSEHGVGTGVHYPIPVHQQKVYRDLGYDDHLPVAEQASQGVISLPVHPALSPEDLDVIVQAVSGL